MQDWLQFHFGFCHEMKENPILLIVDDFSGHWTDVVQRHAEKVNVHLMRFPPGYTCVAAPPGVAWNSSLKKFLRKEWLTNLYNQVNAPREPNEAFKLNPPTRPLLVSWDLRAWESVSTRTIAAGFKGVGIETNLFPPKTLPGPLEKVDTELEKLSNSVFDELAKLELIDKEFTISSEDSDAFYEEESKSEIIMVLLWLFQRRWFCQSSLILEHILSMPNPMLEKRKQEIQLNRIYALRKMNAISQENSVHCSIHMVRS
jgi:hypothetical protein